MADNQWWYCLKHKQVESSEDACKAVDRLGPYATRDEAEAALARVAERNEEWDSDPNWNDDV